MSEAAHRGGGLRGRITPRTAFVAFAGGLALLLFALIVLPMLRTLRTSFFPNGALSLAPFREAAGVRGIGTILWNTARYTVATAALATAGGVFLAWANERTDARMGRVAWLFPILPLMIPPIGTALGYVMLFSDRQGTGNLFLRWLFGLGTHAGPVNVGTFGGLVVVSALSLTPIVYLMVSAALNNLDSALDEASRVFGGTPLGTAWRITLPLVWPAITSAMLLVAIQSVSSFVFPFFIGTGAGITTLSVLIYRMFAIYPTHQDVAVGLSILLLLIVYGGLFLQTRVARRGGAAVVAGKHSSRSLVGLGPWKGVVRALMLAYLVAVFLPLIGLVIGSLQPWLGAGIALFTLHNFATVLGNSQTQGALVNSFVYGVLAASIDMVLVSLLVYAGMRLARRGGSLIEYVLMAPSVIPHIVLAVAFVLTFGAPPFNLYGTGALVLIAYCVMFLPEASRAASAAVAQTNVELSEASHMSQAGLLRTYVSIILPQIRGGTAAGWIVVFFLAVNEVTASSFLGGLQNPVVGFVATEYFSTGQLSQVAAISLVVTAITAGFVLLFHRFIRGSGT